MMKHAWDSYILHAWGSNEPDPVNEKGQSGDMPEGMGLTIVSSLDTLHIMGMEDDFEAGKVWVRDYMDLNKVTGFVSVFNTNIKIVGGLLTAYSFTGDEIFKEKTVKLVDKLLPAFDTDSGIPYSLVNLRGGEGKSHNWAKGLGILSEFGSLHMEFSYLSDITGNPVYRQKVERVREVLTGLLRPKKLYPSSLNIDTGRWGNNYFSIGAYCDSFFEYLLKEWIRSGNEDEEVKS